MEVQPGVVLEAFQKAGRTRQEAIQGPPGGLARVPAAEAMLIRLLLEDAQAREEIAARLQSEGLVSDMECAAIISGILTMRSAEIELDLSALSDRLPAEEQRVLAEIAFNKESRPVSAGEIETYLGALERKRLLRQRGSLQSRIKDAEKSNDSRLAIDLLEEQKKLDKRLAQLL
jgi:hypothetical protein